MFLLVNELPYCTSVLMFYWIFVYFWYTDEWRRSEAYCITCANVYLCYSATYRSRLQTPFAFQTTERTECLSGRVNYLDRRQVYQISLFEHYIYLYKTSNIFIFDWNPEPGWKHCVSISSLMAASDPHYFVTAIIIVEIVIVSRCFTNRMEGILVLHIKLWYKRRNREPYFLTDREVTTAVVMKHAKL
jgi:hypothetical protein